MNISKITNPEIEHQIERMLNKSVADADVRSAKDGSFVPHFTAESVTGFGCSNGGDRAYVRLQDKAGTSLTVEFEMTNCATILEGIVRAREAAKAVGAGETEKFILTGWTSWELGHMADGTVVLFFDKGTPTQKAFPFVPKTVFDIGRAFISVARTASKVRSRIVRN
jgi:hypothetical protein